LCFEELPRRSNYFHGNNPRRWLTNIRNYARVRYENVYPGIDLVYHGNHQMLEHDYILAPAADPQRVRLRLRGASTVRLSPSGDLVMDVQGSSILLKRPQAYQTGRGGTEQVLARYTFLGKELVGVELGPYDHRRSLIIDPVLSYSTYLGGTGGDTGAAVTVDSSGDIYVVGTTSSADFPVTAGVVQGKLAGGSDVFVTKLSPAGSPVFSTFLGGTGNDSGAGVAIDSAGNIYVTGTTYSADFPTTHGVVQTALNGSSDAFVTKLSSDGSKMVYSTYLGGSGTETCNSIAVDSSGSAYVTGSTSSADFPITSGSFQPTYGGNSDAFITKLSPDATSLVYSSFLGGSSSDSGAGVAVDAAGEAFLTGATSSTDFPTVTPLQAKLAGGSDAFVAKVSSDGKALVFSTYLGGKGDDQGAGLALDKSDNVYLTGSTSSDDFPTVSPAQSKLGGGTDAFVSELKADGSALVYSTYLGGSDYDSGNGIAVDSSGNAYVVGLTASSDFPSVKPIEGYSGSFFSPYDSFLVQVASGGSSFAFSSYLGGSGYDSANAVALAAAGNVYIVGTTTSSDFPTTLGSFQPTFGNVSNVFVARVGPANEPGFSVSPFKLTFSDQALGTSSYPQAITVRNMGSGLLNISSIATTGDFAEAGNCGSLVFGATECTVSVTFSPTARGTRNGTLVFSDDGPGSPQTINLSGNGVSPLIILAPSSLVFPGQPLNTTGPTQTVTMSNSGLDPSNIAAILTSGDFTQTNTCGTKLEAGASCTITVAFTPTLNGTRTGTLFVIDNSAGSPHMVSLTGTGIGPDAKVAPGILTFNGQPVGTTSAPQVVTLTNDGSAAMTIAGIQTIGVFAHTTNCGGSLAAGANCTVSVTFNPTAPGMNSGVLMIADNAPGNPHTVDLIGNAVAGPAPVAALTPASLSFAPQPVNTVGPGQTLTLANTGNATLNVTYYRSGDFTVRASTCGPRIAAGASCTTQIASLPKAVGPTTGTFSITDNAPGSPQTATFSGSGTDFGMSASPGGVAITAGKTATYTLTLIPVYGFKENVSLTCGDVPQTTTCSISPTSVTLDGTNPATATVTVSTTARSTLPLVGGRPRPLRFVAPFSRVGPMLLLMLAVLTAIAATRRGRRTWLTAGVLLLVLLWGACAVGTEKITGTLAGNYTFTVTGTYTSNGSLQHSLQLGLTVN
jgi:hypothetical protein